MTPTFRKKATHAISYNNTVNRWVTPVIKVIKCQRMISFNKLSPAFQKERSKLPSLRDLGTNGKILVCGLPKSGNSWLCKFFATYFGSQQLQPFYDLDVTGVGMNHFSPGIDILYRQDFLRCVYIIRDLRDIIVSFYYYANSEYHIEHVNANYRHFDSIDGFYFGYFLPKVVKRYQWFENPFMYQKLNVPMVRFEDLKARPYDEFRNLLIKARIEIDDKKLVMAIKKSSFESIQAENGSANEYTANLPALPKTHYRRGNVGDGRMSLSSRVLEDIRCRFGCFLKHWDYSF